MAERHAPPIPATCEDRPTTKDGLVIPYGNVQLADGGADFRSHHHAAWRRCWQRDLCQVCGKRLGRPMVLLCGPNQLAALLFDEPATHPECAAYVAQACPMVAGHRTHYREGRLVSAGPRGDRCATPGCDCGGWIENPTSGPTAAGQPAHDWFAVYVRGYTLAATVERGLTGGICAPADVFRVRQVSSAGEGPLHPWRPVPDWRDRYDPPQLDVPPNPAEVAPWSRS